MELQKVKIDTQKCLRVSVKHNDLEDVGLTPIITDVLKCLETGRLAIFQERSIGLGLGILTEVLKLDKDRLYVSVFEGNPAENVPF